jgi:hypothetical protein
MSQAPASRTNHAIAAGQPAAGAAVFQIRAITRARYPTLRAVAALAATVPLFLVMFASAYLAMVVGVLAS